MKTRGHVALLTAVVVASVSPAFAVEEIVVTAQRREEKLQDVPLAVSAFTADSIRNRQIDVVKDIGQNVPNLQTYTITAGAQALQVHSRGASIQNPGFNISESPVGIYVDDVYFGRLASANLDLSDIERIEVLRGPQGTLYGRNTIAGAIKVISRTPGNDSWLDASAGIGNYDTTKITGSVGGAIVDDALAGSASAVYDKRNEGWQDNPLTGAEPGEYENKVARGKLHWYGTDRLDAVLTLWGADLTNDGYNGVPYAPFANPPGPDSNFLPAPADSAPVGGFYSNFDPNGVNYGRSNQWGSSLTLSYEFGGTTLRSITGFASIDDEFGFDLAGGGFFGVPGVTGLLITSDGQQDQLSQEFQLLGTAFGDALNWLAGLYYLNEDGSQSFAGDLGFFGRIQEDTNNETDSYAVFGEATYVLTDALSVTGGVRWTQDDKTLQDVCTDGGPNLLGCQGGPLDLDDSWDETTFKAGVDYKLSDSQLTYLQFSQGFQAGGFRTLCLGNLTATCGATPFDPQTVDSFELGYKADLFNQTLRFNADVFYAMYSDIQQIVIPPGNAGTSFPIDNIGDVDVYGVEVEIQWSPADNLNLYANAGYQESNFGTVDCGSPPSGFPEDCDVPDSPLRATPTKELPSNPQFQGKIGFDYTLPVSDMVEFFYGADMFYSDNYFSEARNLVEIESYTRVNGFLGIGDPDRGWQIVLAAKNITDEEDNVSGLFAQNFTNIRTPLPPTEYMLTFKVNY